MVERVSAKIEVAASTRPEAERVIAAVHKALDGRYKEMCVMITQESIWKCFKPGEIDFIVKQIDAGIKSQFTKMGV